MGKSQRIKGHSFERLCSQLLREHGYPQAGRKLEYQFDKATGEDIEGCLPFKIQCKCMAKVPNIPQVFKEFTSLKPGEIPVVMFRVTNRGTYAVLRIEAALNLMEYESHKEENVFHDGRSGTEMFTRDFKAEGIEPLQVDPPERRKGTKKSK